MISRIFVARSLCTAALGFFAAPPIHAALTETDGPQDGQRLTAASLIARVLAGNPSLPATQAAWQAAAARIEQAAALDDPAFAYTIAPATIGASGTDFGQNLELSQRFPWPGTLRLREDAARFEAEAAREAIADVRLKLVSAATALSAQWYVVHEALRINRANRTLLEEFRAIAVSRYATGYASQQDALRADVEVNRLVQRNLVLERQRREVAARINTLLNRPPDASLPPPAELVEPPQPADVKSLRAKARRTRPELKALEARTRALKARVGLAERAYFPDLTVKAGYNTLWDREQQRFTVGLGITLPLDQSKRRAAEDEAKARIRQNEWERSDQSARIDQEVQLAYDRLQEGFETLALYRDSILPLAEQELAAALSDYQSGIGDFLNLISSEQNLRGVQVECARALADLHIRFAELERAAGLLPTVTADDDFGGEAP